MLFAVCNQVKLHSSSYERMNVMKRKWNFVQRKHSLGVSRATSASAAIHKSTEMTSRYFSCCFHYFMAKWNEQEEEDEKITCRTIHFGVCANECERDWKANTHKRFNRKVQKQRATERASESEREKIVNAFGARAFHDEWVNENVFLHDSGERRTTEKAR